MIITRSSWENEIKLLTTQISGIVSLADVLRWKDTLQEAFAEVEDGSTFKILVNLHGFKAENFEVHKAFREIIPRTLAGYGWRVGYLDMFPEATLSLYNQRGIQCKAAAHVHHDETKIVNYETNYSSAGERFFTDAKEAEYWIKGLSID